jgi:hypothetical protein
MSLSKPSVVQVDQTGWQLVKEVVKEHNDGAFLKISKSTGVNKIFEKIEVWNFITTVFN